MSEPSPPLAPTARAAAVIVPTVGPGTDPTVARVARALPAPTELEPGAWLAVAAGTAAPAPGLLARLLQRPPDAGISLELRCTALLARGYVEICADATGLAWGLAP